MDIYQGGIIILFALAISDLIVGVNAAAWADVAFDVLDGYYGGIELQLGQYTFVQIYVTHGAINEVIQSPVLPSLNFYWRF